MKKNLFLHALTAFACMMAAVLLCAAQTSFLPHYVNDAYIVPDLLLCMTLALGILIKKPYGAIYSSLFGIFAGILADCTGGFGISLLPLFYMLCGYGAFVCADILHEILPKKRLPLYFVIGLLAAFLRTVVAVIYVFLYSGSVPIPEILRYVCIPLFLGTSLALLPTYFVSLLLTLPLKKV